MKKEIKMKHRCVFGKLIFVALVFLYSFLVLSCYTPSPLYGTWVDSSTNNSLVIQSTGDFVARIKGDSGTTTTYQGTYTVIDNTLIFLVTDPYSYTVPTEWDVRGSILYCTWTNEDDEIVNLSLYHTSR